MSTSFDVGQAEILITYSSCRMTMSLEQVWNRGLIVIQDADQYGISYYEKHQFKVKHLSHTFSFEM